MLLHRTYFNHTQLPLWASVNANTNFVMCWWWSSLIVKINEWNSFTLIEKRKKSDICVGILMFHSQIHEISPEALKNGNPRSITNGNRIVALMSITFLKLKKSYMNTKWKMDEHFLYCHLLNVALEMTKNWRKNEQRRWKWFQDEKKKVTHSYN